MYPWLDAVEREFSERLGSGRLAHAMLLSGPAGTGKSELSARFLAGLLCIEGGYPPCGRCRSCALLKSGAHPDGHVVSFEPHPKKEGEFRTEIVIDQVRRLVQALQLTITVSPRKAAVIVPAEAMNRNAVNALLKTLEEPPGDAVLLLVSHRPERLPATIRSRCQALHVRQPEPAVCVGWLTGQSGAGEDAAALALEAAANRPLDALRLLREEDGVVAYREVSETLDALRGGRGEATAALARLAEIEPERLWTWLSLRAARETRQHLDRPPEAARLARLQQLADRHRRLLPSAVRKDLLLQDWLIQWARPDA